ncbi:MAG: 16S rRNA (guanine(527)-N(7))-methyltransferase RsmG [Chloroflexi bacterium]|nr:16S rRNA (guanine(527)-N(7))-methyltransferase RsmG [Chloroflexota bacterium]
MYKIYYMKKIIEYCRYLGISITKEQIEKINYYVDFLIKENKKYNLTGIKQKEEILSNLVLKSLIVFHPHGGNQSTIEWFHDKKILDIGTGAGIPGLIVKIISPISDVFLLDSNKKKCEFISQISKKLNLSGLTVINDRAEIIAHENEFREKFDLVVSRAVGNLSELSEINIPFIKIGGISMALKGKNIQDEINLSKNASNIMGAAPPSVVKIRLPAYSIDDSIVYWMKINKTPKNFPRKIGIPHKNPIT